MDERRCARGAWCQDASKMVGGTWAGARVHDPNRQFCPVCLRYLRYALIGLPLDVAELTTRLVPSMQVVYRDPTVPSAPRVKLHSPVPLDTHADALRSLIVHEVTAWAESLADDLDQQCAAQIDADQQHVYGPVQGQRFPWDTDAVTRMRDGAAVQVCAAFLLEHTDHLLGLGDQLHRVRSAGADVTDGWTPESVDAMENDDHGQLWIRRNGTEAALVLFDLHRRVETWVGRATSDRLALPCPKCSKPALHREHRHGRITCRCCWVPMTDQEYEDYVAALDAVWGDL